MRQLVPLQSKISRHLALQEMVGHRYLSRDELAQESQWSDGTRIAVNFSDAPYDDGDIQLPPKGFRVLGGPGLGTLSGSVRHRIEID